MFFMRIRVDLRIVALLAVVLLSLGLTAQATMSAEMGGRVMGAYGEVPLSQNCGACGGDASMPQEACYGMCTASTAVLPSPMVVKAVALGTSMRRTEPSQVSRRAAPDPYPS